MKSDKTWKILFTAFLVLLAMAIGVYAYGHRYTEVRLNTDYGSRDVTFDRWTQEVVVYTTEGVKRAKIKAPNKAPNRTSFFTSDSPSINEHRLHRVLTEDYHYKLGTLDEMRAAITGNKQYCRWLYGECTRIGLNVGTYREFKKALRLH